jgi:hypothetical protein
MTMQKKVIKMPANELSEADIEWISLVDRPANRIPFRLMKAEEVEPNTERSNLMLNLTGLFSRKAEEKAPSIAAIVLRKEDSERMLPQLEAAGFAVDNLESAEDIVIVKQEDFDPEAVVTVKLKNETAVLLSNVSKAFTPYPETMNFDEKLKAAGFFPSVAMATDALMDTVYGVMGDARSPDEVASKMEEAIKSYSDFVLGLTATLPVVAFKVEALSMKAEETPDIKAEEVSKEDKPGDAAPAEAEGTADVEATKAEADEAEVKKDEGEAADAVSKEDSGEDAGKDVTKDEDTDKEVGRDAADQGTEAALAGLLQTIEAMKAEVTEGLAAVRGDLEKVKADTAEFAGRVEKVEKIATSAETAVKGTILGGGEDLVPSESLGNESRSMRNKSEEDLSLWDGSPLDSLGL